MGRILTHEHTVDTSKASNTTFSLHLYTLWPAMGSPCLLGGQLSLKSA